MAALLLFLIGIAGRADGSDADTGGSPSSGESYPMGRADNVLRAQAPDSSNAADPAVHAQYREYLLEYYTYSRDALHHRRAVFNWQLLSSKLIFFVVIVTVSLGLRFSAKQFSISARLLELSSRRGAAPSKAGGTVAAAVAGTIPEQAGTTIEASPASGIKISSPLIGVIVLAISLAFFYLYLAYVYPVHEAVMVSK